MGAAFHKEQSFQQTGVGASLAMLCGLTVLTLVLPTFTVSEPRPVYSGAQLGFVAVVSFLLYATFAGVQTVRHRDYFPPDMTLAASGPVDPDLHAPPPMVRQTAITLVLLPESVAAVRAALANQLQKSLDLGLGSALPTIALTIPRPPLSPLMDPPIAPGSTPRVRCCCS